MTPEPGKTLLHYRLAEKIGEGGMGVVWKARDTTLDRDVAIKILPPEFQQDPDRPARFQREAKLLAQLNHPHIASIYGLHEAEGIRFISMELVPGEDLSQRLKRGPLPLDAALEIAHQIAEALETAHEQGVIHRDLKPANIKLGAENQVKVLDFGLAKAFESDASSPDARASLSPTLTSAGTRAGMLLGTAAYMSPEQARGHAVDKRADIWAFGAVLYELLTGKQAFHGETISDSLAAVLKLEADLSLLPADTPEAVRRLLGRCLEKRPKQRLRDIGEARIRVEEALGRSEPAASIAGAALDAIPAAVDASATAAAPPGRSSLLPWILCAVAIVAAVAAFLLPRGPAPSPQPVMRVEMVMSEDSLSSVPGMTAVLSPDGTRMAYVAGDDDRIHVRMADQLEGTPLSGTGGAWQPFFSPDGEWIGFFAEGKLKKVSVFGGAPLTLCGVEDRRGGTWGPDGTIVFAPDTTSGLYRVPDTGGEPEELTVPDKEKRERSHRWPHFLPGGNAVLFTAQEQGTSFDEARIEVLDLRTMERKVLQPGGSYAAYVPTGHLVYVHEGTLFAAPFDASSLELEGSPGPVLEEVFSDPRNGGAHYQVSAAGHLLYRTGGPASRSLTLSWIDREGIRTAALAEPKDYSGLSLSPDGTRLLTGLIGESTNSDLWIHDFGRDTLSRLTFHDQRDFLGVWTPDGQRIVFSSLRDADVPNLHWKRADGTGEVERLTESENAQYVSEVTPDGKFLLYSEEFPETGFDIVLLPLAGERQPSVFLRTPFVEVRARVSPDGRWVVYSSNESGAYEIYVRPFPDGQGKWQISTGGSNGPPAWSPDGSELFYRNNDDLMVVDVSTEGSRFVAGKPRLLVERGLGGVRPRRNWDVHPDGRRFIVIDRDDEDTASDEGRVTLVVNWFDELRRRAPGKR
jgi:serine/threonine-protein kinase